MNALALVGLPPLMEVTSGKPEIAIGLIDGPVAIGHRYLANENVRVLRNGSGGSCKNSDSVACQHGTFVAGILSARRDSPAPAICPGCTLVVRPIFPESAVTAGSIPSATPQQLAAAIIECIDSGARLLNLSAALTRTPSAKAAYSLNQALDYAANRDAIIVVSAGNHGIVGTTAITRHPAVIPVTACDRLGRPLTGTNLGNTISRWGLAAPGEGVTSLGTDGTSSPSGGTSVAAPFVTGALALIWSEFPRAKSADLRIAITHAHGPPNRTVIPALLNAWGTYNALQIAFRQSHGH